MNTKLTEKGKQLLYFIRSAGIGHEPMKYEVYCSACKRQNRCKEVDIGGPAKVCRNFVMIDQLYGNIGGRKDDN